MACNPKPRGSIALSLRARCLQLRKARMDALTSSSTTIETMSDPSKIMEKGSFIEGDRLPPRGGLPLGVVLGVTISVLVGLLLGGLTAVQLYREERRELVARQDLLAESLAPLAAEIERASSLGEIEKQLLSSARAEVARGQSDFNLLLVNNDGRPIASALSSTISSPPPIHSTPRFPFRSKFFETEGGVLTAWQSDSEFITEMTTRRYAAWLDIGVAVFGNNYRGPADHPFARYEAVESPADVHPQGRNGLPGQASAG